MGELKPTNAYLGMNLDSVIEQVKPGQVTYALNAQISGFEGNSVLYQNEQANEYCFTLPEGYVVIGTHQIIEINTVIYWIVNQDAGLSEIGKVVNESCAYETIINGDCLGFSIHHPILKAVHKITNCSIEVYWTDGYNPRRWLDLNNLPFTEMIQGTNTDPCNIVTVPIIDCNKLNVQPNFAIPQIDYVVVADDGNTLAGTYQFAVQYSNALGDPYTAFYSVTNPIPIHDPLAVTPNFNYATGKSIQIDVTNIDTTGIWQYFNVAVVKTINNISSVDLVGTFQIESNHQKILYTGQSKAGITLTIDDIFEKFNIYDTAGDLTTVQDILVWDDLTSTERISLQQVANNIRLEWVSYILPPNLGGFKDELNSADYRGYMRDEVYAFDMVIVDKNGYQTDRFSIPGREALATDLTLVNNGDTNFGDSICDGDNILPRWKVYNTAFVSDVDSRYTEALNAGTLDCYQGPYQFGQFSYWESTETYPCNEAVWGTLAGGPIRHHKFPDSAVTHHYDQEGNIFPLGVRVDMQQVYTQLRASGLTSEQLNRIAEVKIVRGNRANAKSIIAKGMLYNVGVYGRDNSTYFYPNYPYNDLREDPFIQNASTNSNGILLFNQVQDNDSIGATETTLFDYTITAGTFANDNDTITADWQGTFSNTTTFKRLRVYFANGQLIFDSGQLNVNSSTSWEITSSVQRLSTSSVKCITVLTLSGTTSTTSANTVTLVNLITTGDQEIKITGTSSPMATIPIVAPVDGDIVGRIETISYKPSPVNGINTLALQGFTTSLSHERFTFHSPDTSFYQPFLGNTLKLETVEYGISRSHFVQTKGHARYRFPSLNSYLASLTIGVVIGFASGTYGFSNNVFNGQAAFTAFTTFNDVVFRLIPRKNFAFQFNSLGEYVDFAVVPNDIGNKIRRIDIGTYLSSIIQGVGDINPVNNWERESSVYIRTTTTTPFPDTYQGVPQDQSRFVNSDNGCNTSFTNKNISSYYGSIKTDYPDQYGQIYSYDAVDTGAQYLIDLTETFDINTRYMDVFGGDTFINKFAFKRKLPFFIDNRVNNVDDSDVFYDELGNIGYPTYWFSTDITKGSGGSFGIGSLFGVKVNNFDCKEGKFFYDSGKFYLFAYGVPYFFVESQVNVDYRQAYNGKEGDYFPHVAGDVPDEWVQEINVPITFDNTYTYNKTFSKQNAENVFTTLPTDFIPNQECNQRFPNKAVYSDRQEDLVFYKKNNWLIYRPVSFFDFPLNYGKLTSLEGIENRSVLARFENKSMIYNALLTVNTSNPQAAYIGNDTLFKGSPPIDFVETDLGYSGSQHKFFLRTEHGNITVDAKRGNIFVMGGTQLHDLAAEGLHRFFELNLEFQLGIAFPGYPIDNHFKGVGLTGVYDEKYERLILTKLDYKPIVSGIIYDTILDTFNYQGNTIELTNTDYFCNVSFTVSYSFDTRSWISFHSYIPNFYVGAIGKFYSGSNTLKSLWRHDTSNSVYNTYYGTISPYILEYPYAYKFQDEILQSIKDYTKVNQVIDYQRFVQTNEIFFNKAVIYNDQQNSGILNLINKPKNNLMAYLQYPKYNTNSRDILFVKSDNFYNYNGFWDIVKDYTLPVWRSDCNTLSEDKILNDNNLDYTNRSFKKYQIRAKDCRIRHILDNRGDVRMTSQFIATETQVSYK